MKCTSCNTYVSKIPVNWKCPHCGEMLPEPGFWFKFSEGFTEYLEEKGAIFWTISLSILMICIGLVEMLLGDGYLLRYLGTNVLFSAVMLLFGGMLIDMYMKIVLPLRVLYGPSYILKERSVIRNIRKGTHIAGIAGILTSVFMIGPRTFFLYFPSFFIVIGWFLALAWSIAGLFIEPRNLEDSRFRGFLDKIGITSLKRYRRLGTYFIGILVLIPIVFIVLMNIPSLAQQISNWALLGTIVSFTKSYLSWLL